MCSPRLCSLMNGDKCYVIIFIDNNEEDALSKTIIDELLAAHAIWHPLLRRLCLGAAAFIEELTLLVGRSGPGRSPENLDAQSCNLREVSKPATPDTCDSSALSLLSLSPDLPHQSALPERRQPNEKRYEQSKIAYWPSHVLLLPSGLNKSAASAS